MSRWPMQTNDNLNPRQKTGPAQSPQQPVNDNEGEEEEEDNVRLNPPGNSTSRSAPPHPRTKPSAGAAARWARSTRTRCARSFACRVFQQTETSPTPRRAHKKQKAKRERPKRLRRRWARPSGRAGRRRLWRRCEKKKVSVFVYLFAWAFFLFLWDTSLLGTIVLHCDGSL